ncbi:thermonuclease family protein [Tersicoccus sp. Bi-70]|uniref:thermonuclease family protein n=1 Tax=Tersicoccus sp. Bi-70 TaxID=1897634 RepID=UPI0013018DCE|nr:thermonuclease family protein [Tersicoccus sp. Bi-70]
MTAVDAVAADGDIATVVRVIDGDTFDATLHGKVTRIRLLNVDTPETKHPNKAVQCQGPEATRALTDLLPVGSTVSLDYDVERTDRYGRTLAAVTGPTGVFVNSELARLGLGVAVIFKPNVKWYDAVKKAQDEATTQRRGLFDPTIGCTIPAAEQSVGQTISTGTEDTAAAAQATADRLTSQIARLEAIRSLLMKPPTGFVVAGLFSSSDLEALIGRAKARRTTADTTASTLRADETRAAGQQRAARAAAQREADRRAAAAAQEAQAEEARQARVADAERQAAAEAAAQQAAADDAARAAAQQAAADDAARAAAQQAAADEAARAAAQQAADQAAAAEAERQAEAARQAQEQQQAPAPAPADPYPGYHGPRCYEPGGQVWHPCG